MTMDEIGALERELEHARAIALTSIGQADHADNVAYCNVLEAKLHAARRAAALRTAGLQP